MTEEAVTEETVEPQHVGSANRAFMALTFELHDEVFAIEIAHVHEVIDPLPVTQVPNADPFAPGLINARGAIVPVLDLQHRLGMKPKPKSQETRFVVLETVISEDRTKFAMVADRVHEVVEFDESAIQPAPELGMQWPNEFIRGIVQRNGTLVILLNTDTAFRPDVAA